MKMKWMINLENNIILYIVSYLLVYKTEREQNEKVPALGTL